MWKTTLPHLIIPARVLLRKQRAQRLSMSQLMDGDNNNNVLPIL